MSTTNKNTPLISICLPVYNRASLISLAIDSVMKQTYPHWELLIIDDGSTDGSLAQAEWYTKQDSRIKVFTSEHKGHIHARKIAMRHAQGDIIAFIDSDDQYKREHLEQHIQFLQTHPEAQGTYSYTEVIGDPYIPDVFDTTQRIHVDKCVLFGTMFLRRELIPYVLDLPEDVYSADHFLYERVIQDGHTMIHTLLRTYIYNRTTPDALTRHVS